MYGVCRSWIDNLTWLLISSSEATKNIGTGAHIAEYHFGLSVGETGRQGNGFQTLYRVEQLVDNKVQLIEIID